MAELWIPETAKPPREPDRTCLTCGRKFPNRHRSQWQRHVLACSKKHPEQMEAEIHKHENTIFLSAQDKEREKFISKQKATKGIR